MSDNRISVITPVHAPSIPYLMDAYQSLRSQEMPESWRWEWLIQCDGPIADSLPDPIRTDPRCMIDENRPSGPGPTRNMAFARSTGSIIRNLDADDRLTDGSLARNIRAHIEHPEIGWTTSTAYDCDDETGELSRWVHGDPEPGLVEVGWVLRVWEDNDWKWLPNMPTSMSIKRDLLLRLGGWMALPTSEDTGLLVAASALAPGHLEAEPGLIYRKHNAQVTASPEHRDAAHAEQRRTLIVARARALQDLVRGTRETSAAPADEPTASSASRVS